MAATGVVRINDPNSPHHSREGVVSARVDVRLFATDTEPERYATFPAGHVEPTVADIPTALQEAFRAYFENDDPTDTREPEVIVHDVLGRRGPAEIKEWLGLEADRG